MVRLVPIRLVHPYQVVFYGCSVMVFFLFFTINMTPKTNFIASDFWQWLCVHMWFEATFAIFTTVIAANFYREMGIVCEGRLLEHERRHRSDNDPQHVANWLLPVLPEHPLRRVVCTLWTDVADPLIQNLAKMRSVGGNLFVWFGL